MKNMLSRRRVLAGMSSAVALPLTPKISAMPQQTTGVFRHGVASGDPDHSSLVIWTRLTTDDSQPQVTWELATDSGFEQGIRTGTTSTNAERDFTIKVLISDLEPGRRYYYRFRFGTHSSILGRTLTLPLGHAEKLGIAVASCSNYPFGYFNAYDAIARDPDIDLVLHLGDYIYEYAPDGWGGEMGAQLGRVHEPAHEIVSLQDYRTRHAQYKSDAGSQQMHAAHPLIAIWDDHESTNNPWMGGAQNHQPDTEGEWAPRRDASLQAYFDWMPVRDPQDGMSRAQYWRHFQYGDLASLITLETRHTGRDKQIDYLEHLPSFDTRAGTDRFLAEVLGDSSRRMLSSNMEGFLAESISQSLSAERPWRIIGNQIPMARTHVPRLDHPYFQPKSAGEPDPIAEEWAYMIRMGELNLPIYLDTWDGYPAARETFYETCRNAGARDLLVLTGDSHSFWQNQLFDHSGARMGVELGTTGISSPGDFLRFGLEGAELMDKMLAEHNEEVIWTETRYNGYVRLVLDHEKARTDFVAVSTVLSNQYQVSVLKTEQIVQQNGSLTYA